MGDDGWSDAGSGWLKQISGGAVCKNHPLSYLMLSCGEGGTEWRRLRLGSSGAPGPLGASFGAQEAQMKLTYGGLVEGCRSSVQLCGSFHGRTLHPCQAQPETCWPFGNLLFVHERASVSAGGGGTEGQGGGGGLGEGFGAAVHEGTQ